MAFVIEQLLCYNCRLSVNWDFHLPRH